MPDAPTFPLPAQDLFYVTGFVFPKPLSTSIWKSTI
jgi:hypothetical protein